MSSKEVAVLLAPWAIPMAEAATVAISSSVKVVVLVVAVRSCVVAASEYWHFGKNHWRFIFLFFR